MTDYIIECNAVCHMDFQRRIPFSQHREEAASVQDFEQESFENNLAVFVGRTRLYDEAEKRALSRRSGGLIADYKAGARGAVSGTVALLLCLQAAREGPHTPSPMSRSNLCNLGDLFTLEFAKKIHDYLKPSFEVLARTLAQVCFEAIVSSEQEGHAEAGAHGESEDAGCKCSIRTLLDGTWASARA